MRLTCRKLARRFSCTSSGLALSTASGVVDNSDTPLSRSCCACALLCIPACFCAALACCCCCRLCFACCFACCCCCARISRCRFRSSRDCSCICVRTSSSSSPSLLSPSLTGAPPTCISCACCGVCCVIAACDICGGSGDCCDGDG